MPEVQYFAHPPVDDGIYNSAVKATAYKKCLMAMNADIMVTKVAAQYVQRL